MRDDKNHLASDYNHKCLLESVSQDAATPSISNDTPFLRIWVNSENSNGLSVVRHRSDAFHVDIASTICIFGVICVFMFRVPRAHDVFVSPGFEPLTLKHDCFVGPGFDSRAQSPVSGLCIRGLSLTPTIGELGWLAVK